MIKKASPFQRMRKRQEHNNVAAAPEIVEKTYNFRIFNAKIIQKIFSKDTSDFSFCFCRRENDRTEEPKKVDAHKALLSAISPVFEAMFSGNWKELTNVEITDASFDAFNAFIEYFYSEQVTISAENVGDILYLAHKYNISELVSSCSSFLLERLNVDDAVACFSLADTFELAELKTKCKAMISLDTIKVLESEGILQCDKNVLFELLSMQHAQCSQEKIFDACIKWAQNRCIDIEQKIYVVGDEKLRAELGNCFDLIRFEEMGTDARNKRINLYKDMFSKDEIINILTHKDINYIPIRQDVVFEFKKYNCENSSFRFTVSRDIKLKSISTHDFNGSVALKICVYDLQSRCIETVHERKIIPAASGISCFELGTAFTFYSKFRYTILLGDNLMVPIKQTVQGVTLDPLGDVEERLRLLSIFTYSFNFETID